jgi:hypothetical protein
MTSKLLAAIQAASPAAWHAVAFHTVKLFHAFLLPNGRGKGMCGLTCEGDNAKYTVRPVFARCLILVARVVSRKHYNHFLGALILQ